MLSLGYGVLVVCVLCLQTLAAVPHYPTPPDTEAYRVYFTAEGMNNMAKLAEPQIIQRTLAYPWPNLEQDIKLPGIGDVTFALSDILFSEVSIADMGVAFTDGVMNLVASIAASLKFNFDYAEKAWPYLGDSGYGDASLEGVDISVAMTIPRDPVTYLPVPQYQDTNVHVGSIDVDLVGNHSDLYNVLLELLNPVIVDLAEAFGVVLIDTAADWVVSAWKEIRWEDPLCGIDNRVAEEYFPIEDAFVVMPSIGQFYTLDNPSVPLVPAPSPLPQSIITGDDIQVVVDETCISSDMVCHHMQGYLTGEVLPDAVDVQFDQLMTVGFIETVTGAPGLYKYLPDDPLSLYIESVAVPTTQILPSGLKLSGSLNVTAYASADATNN
ncbi:hypothetical protein KIPB_010779, partial [Kipferlia bialata]|eukprot:g10779.t1